MEFYLSCHLPEYSFIIVCLEKIQNSNYELNEQAFINDLQILNNYQNNDPLKYTNKLSNLLEYLALLNNEEKKFFLNELVRFVASQALRQSEIWPLGCLKYLQANKKDEVSYTKQEVCVLLANMFLMSISRKNSNSKIKGPCPKISFDFIFAVNGEISMKSKLRCIHNYFKRMYERRNDSDYLNLKVTFQRLQFSEEMMRNNQEVVLGDIEVLSETKIEQYSKVESIHTDFANEYLGGGALYDGNVQEEIYFSICPELFVGMIFSQKMFDNEAILVIGFEKFSNYQGYGSQFQVTGEFHDATPIDKKYQRIKSYLTCIDATCFSSLSEAKQQQYEKNSVIRELNKSLVGFQGPFEEEAKTEGRLPIVTGNWGCGMFNGDTQLKLLIQWISCSLHNRKLIYCSLNNEKLINQNDFIYSLKGKQINSILNKIFEYATTNKMESLFQYLKKQQIK